MSKRILPPWDERIWPSEIRFVIDYDNLKEISALAKWLSKTTNIPADIIRTENGGWRFSAASQSLVDRVFANKVRLEYEKIDNYNAALEHWLLNESYYKERLAEDSTWGRDEDGRPFADPG